ncbi:VOC family protein [Kitasatospora sp. NBC_01302]|uniref:VOC family protein n=1 Tax=Kitasatospora sp. NBC_01302 TaxID=2903575 RepID=UPI002E0E1912
MADRTDTSDTSDTARTADTAGAAAPAATPPAPGIAPPAPGAPAPQVWPTLRAGDARGLIRFLTEAFGFEEVFVYGEGEVVEHAELAWPLGGGVMLGSVREGAPCQGAPGSFSAYVVTDDPDALHARAVAAGADVVSPLHVTDYGSRDFAVQDPEGNRWSFGTYRGEPPHSQG